MTTVDHRFHPRPGFDRCVECDEPRDHAGHFGDHVKPIAPVTGFACAGVLNVRERKDRDV